MFRRSAEKRVDEYLKVRLALDQVKGQVDEIQDRLHSVTAIAQQLLVANVAIVALAASAVVGVEQIRLLLSATYAKATPTGDMALANGSLTGFVIFGISAAVSAVLAGVCFMRESSSTELGPTSLGKKGRRLSAAEQVSAVTIVWSKALSPALTRLRWATLLLRCAVACLALGVLIALIYPLVVY